LLDFRGPTSKEGEGRGRGEDREEGERKKTKKWRRGQIGQGIGGKERRGSPQLKFMAMPLKERS